jgi:hypothetical protein
MLNTYQIYRFKEISYLHQTYSSHSSDNKNTKCFETPPKNEFYCIQKWDNQLNTL